MVELSNNNKIMAKREPGFNEDINEEGQENPQLQAAIDAYLLQREDYYKETYPGYEEVMLDGERRIIQDGLDSGCFSDWQLGEDILVCLSHNAGKMLETERPVKQPKNWEPKFILARPGEHERWLALVKYENEILAKSFLEQSLDELKITRDVLVKVLKEAEDTVRSLVGLLNVDVPQELQKSTENVMSLSYEVAEMFEKRQKNMLKI